jgi:hypothetical protein
MTLTQKIVVRRYLQGALKLDPDNVKSLLGVDHLKDTEYYTIDPRQAKFIRLKEYRLNRWEDRKALALS